MSLGKRSRAEILPAIVVAGSSNTSRNVQDSGIGETPVSSGRFAAQSNSSMRDPYGTILTVAVPSAIEYAWFALQGECGRK